MTIKRPIWLIAFLDATEVYVTAAIEYDADPNLKHDEIPDSVLRVHLLAHVVTELREPCPPGTGFLNAETRPPKSPKETTSSQPHATTQSIERASGQRQEREFRVFPYNRTVD